MKAISIQNNKVIDILLKDGVYFADNAPIADNLVKPYEFMMKEYGYKSRPVFMCPIGYCANFSGVLSDNVKAILLNISDEFCRIQKFYDWSDFIYFMEMTKEFFPKFDCNSVEEFGRYILQRCNMNNIKRNDICQVTTDRLDKD